MMYTESGIVQGLTVICFLLLHATVLVHGQVENLGSEGGTTVDEESFNATIASTERTRRYLLLPRSDHIFNVSLPVNGTTNADAIITLIPDGHINVDISCTPEVYEEGRPSIDFTNAPWRSNHSHGDDFVFISQHHPRYLDGLRRTEDGDYVAVFCSIQYNDYLPATVTVEVDLDYETIELRQEDEEALETIFEKCCQSEDSCNAWKEHRARNGSAQSDLCHFHTNVCDTDGQLIRLSLENLNMECDFPYEEITQFTNLKKLLLKGNRFTGQIGTVLDELAELDNLEHLDIQGSKLTDSLPGRGAMETSGICSFARTHLWYLNLASNNISGQIPKCLLYERSKVKVINLSSNKLTGKLPEVTIFSRELEVLDLSENQLTGNIPIVFTGSYVLKVLNLAKNRLTGEVPAEFGFSLLLMSLNLSRNNFSGSFSETLTESRVIQLLDLSYNSLTGNLPDSIGNMARLRVLHLGSNKLTGLLPKSLSSLRSLYFLFLNKNSFTGTIVDVLPSYVVVLDLADNELNGTIPVDVFHDGGIFTNIVGIKSADLSNNAFTRFGDEWYKEDRLVYTFHMFLAASNNIKGMFPPPLALSPMLRSLDLSNNDLRGPLPSNDSVFRSMHQLNLSSNRFVGHIPTSWESSDLFNVQSNTSVDLSFNRLSGALPDFFYETNMNEKFNRTVNLKGNDFDFDCPLPESHLTINGLVCDNDSDSSFAEPSLTDIKGESLKTISVSPAQGSLEGPEKSESISTHSMESEQSITVNTSSAEASGGTELSSLSVPSINEEDEEAELQSSEGDSDDSINALWAPIVAAVGFALLLGLFLIIRRISKSRKAATAVANETAGGPGRRKPVPLISLSTLESSRALTPQPEPPRDDGVQMLIGMQSSAEI